MIKDEILHVEDVYKSYGDLLVLDDVDLLVSAGEFCSVVGPSGCGKSTMLRLVLGQERPTAGKVFIEGKEVGDPDPQRGVVYQRYSLFPHLSVLDNVLLGKRMSSGFFAWSKERPSAQQEAVKLLERMRLAGDRDKYPHQLSGGMRQRVAIAQALIMRPKILLMDEPFGALDPGTREDMQMLLLELWQEYGMTIFFITHDLEEAVFLGTRVLVFSRFYSDGRGDDKRVKRGAKVVADYPVKKGAGATGIKATPEFSETVRKIRREGFDPEYRQHVNEFNLKHEHSWRTLTSEERGDGVSS